MIHRTRSLALLRELNDALALERADPAEWVVCGGTALAISGLVERPTRDLDVIGAWGHNLLEVTRLDRFPESVERAIDRVARAHPELDADGPRWVNLGPRGLLQIGLPSGCLARLTRFDVGSHLALHVPARMDLIALKLLAAADATHPRQPIHQADVRALCPTDAELTFAIDWIRTVPDPNHTLRAELRNFLKDLGHDDHAYYIA